MADKNTPLKWDVKKYFSGLYNVYLTFSMPNTLDKLVQE